MNTKSTDTQDRLKKIERSVLAIPGQEFIHQASGTPEGGRWSFPTSAPTCSLSYNLHCMNRSVDSICRFYFQLLSYTQMYTD